MNAASLKNLFGMALLMLLIVSGIFFTTALANDADAGYSSHTVNQIALGDRSEGGSTDSSCTVSDDIITVEVEWDNRYTSTIEIEVTSISASRGTFEFVVNEIISPNNCVWAIGEFDSRQDEWVIVQELTVGGTYTFDCSDHRIYATKDGDYSGHYHLEVEFETESVTRYTTTASISFDANGGTNAPGKVETMMMNQTTTSGNVDLSIPSVTPVWEDHLFLGWATSSDGDPVYQPGQSVSIGKTVETTYYAQWLSPGDTITATNLSDLVDYATVPDVTINLNLPADAELTEDVIVADGTDIIRVMDKTVTMNGHSIICQGESLIELKLNSQQSGYSRAFGEYELSGCFSIVPDGPYLRFDGTFSDTSTVILRNNGTLISGTLEGDMEFVNGSSVNVGTGVVFEDLTVASGATLELIGNDNVDYSSQGSFNLYGTLKDEDGRDAILLEVDDGSTFTAYSGSSIHTVAVRAAEDSMTATVNTTTATIDLGIYTGGTNYSTLYETYSGIDCGYGTMPEPYGDNGVFYLSMGAEVNIQGNAGGGWFVGIGSNMDITENNPDFVGTVTGYGSTEIMSGEMSSYDLVCMEPMYTVSFDSNGGSSVTSQAVESGSTVVMPDDPELYGYVFGGWFLDDGTFLNEFDFDSPVQGNITLYAKWNEDLRFTTDPVADGTVTSLDGQPGTVNFKATTSKDYSSLVWDFGDGTTSTNTYATHYYSEPGTYTAILTVYNNYGSDTTEFIIEVPEVEPENDAPWLLYIVVIAILVMTGALIARFVL